jgi:hypothetical protein
MVAIFNPVPTPSVKLLQKMKNKALFLADDFSLPFQNLTSTSINFN